MNKTDLYNKIMESVVNTLHELSENQPAKSLLQMIAQSTQGLQHNMFKQKCEDLQYVKIVSIYDVFTDDEIRQIKRLVNPKPKCCFENAWKLCDRLHTHNITYCEGYMELHGLPIEHAFNKVDGKYVDITIELALEDDPTKDPHAVYGDFDTDTVRKILLQNGYYGNIYETNFMNKYKK